MGERSVLNFIGAPGNAKTSIVKQFAQEIQEERLSKGLSKVKCWSLRLNQCDPTDLKGVPIYLQIGDKQFCSFASPSTIPIKGSPESADGEFVIIHLDELPQAVPSMQNLAANIIDGVIGDHEIDLDRTMIIVSGNRKNDKAAVYDTPSNVKTRITTFEIAIPFSEWEEWAIAESIHPAVLGFLKQRAGTAFNCAIPATGDTYPNPRTWHKLSNDMVANGPSWAAHPLSLAFACGTIGFETGVLFHQFAASLNEIDINGILEGKNIPAPLSTQPDMIYGIILELVHRINNLVNEIDKRPGNSLQVKLTDNDINCINNIYTWVSSSKSIDLSFALLLTKFQNDLAKRELRSIQFQDPRFAPTKNLILEINKALGG